MSVITDNQSTRVLFDPNGEALDFTDTNDLQTQILEQLWEVMSVGIADGASDDPSAPGTVFDLDGTIGVADQDADATDLVLTLRPGSAFVAPSFAARTLVITAGPIMRAIAASYQGQTESLAPFWFSGGDSLVTDVGDATNPRIDVVEVKLEYVNSDPTSRDFEDAVTREPTTQTPDKRRRVQATIQIKKGTAAAGPSYPPCSAGFAPLAAVWVPATHNAVHDPANLRDMRWPVGRVYAVDTLPNGAWYPGNTPWGYAHGAPSPDFSAHAPVSGTGDVYFPCPVTSRTTRVVGIGVYGIRNGGACKLVRLNYTASGPLFTDLLDPDTNLLDGTREFSTISAIQMMDMVAGTGVESKGTRSAGTRNGTPIWCNGYSAGPGRRRAGLVDAASSALALKVTNGDPTDRVWFVRWYLAE